MNNLKTLLSPHEVSIFPAFIETKKGKFLMHALLRLKKDEWPDAELQEKLRSLSPSYTIDVDPEHLLWYKIPVTPIIQKENPILREIAEEIIPELFGSTTLKKIISDMQKAAHAEDDAVAIAAPQIAQSFRIFCITSRTRDILKNPDLPLVYINPIITKSSKDKKSMEEGCLSVRWLYGSVKRTSRVTIEAYDEHGKKFSKAASGLLAQIFQHEIDHLDGVLFIDKAKNIRDLPPANEEINKK